MIAALRALFTRRRSGVSAVAQTRFYAEYRTGRRQT